MADENRTTRPERDFDARPYSPDEERVAAWMRQRCPEVGTGDDPIGFLLASYEYMWSEAMAERDRAIKRIQAGDFEVITDE